MELPVLRLGLAGFSPEEEQQLQQIASGTRGTHWQCGSLSGADAWLVNGHRAQSLGEGRVRIGSGHPGGRSQQIQMAEVSRPLAFAAPVAPAVGATSTFDLGSPDSLLETLKLFEVWLAPVQSQFWFAGLIIDHEPMLGASVFELRANSQLIGVLDLKGDAAVLCSARPGNFEAGTFKRIKREAMSIPEHFCRTSVPNLMWQYVSRTGRNVLPERYRTGLLYFRRPPYLDQQLIEDDHLMVMRDLALQPSSFDELRVRTGLTEEALSRTLAALYYVGSITSNRRRAAQSTLNAELASSVTTTGAWVSINGTLRATERSSEFQELTAPAPIRLA
jgi:hypothetical protein